MSGQDEQGKIDSAASNISKGVDKKEDTIMMLMAPEANWDQFFTPAPFAIALLEDLIIISAGTDFSLEEKPPKAGFKHLRYPHSFRASLVQVSNSIWDAFSEAHTSMDQIRLHSLNVDTHVKNALKFRLKGSPEEVELMLPLSLNKIDKIANEILQPPLKIIENHFVFVMQLTAELLEAIEQRQDKAFEELKETNDRLTEVLKEMGTLDTQKIDFDIFRDKLVKCIKALQEQWGKLVRFFHMLSNFIKCCITSSLKDFVHTVDIGRQLSSEGKPLSDNYRDVIFEQATQANKVVYVVHIIAKTYVQVSEKHLMDRITCLGQLIALDPKKDEHEIQQRIHALYNSCRKAQDAIKALVSEEKGNFHRQIEARI